MPNPGKEQRKFVDADSSRCIGCGICELVCSFEKSKNQEFNSLKSRIKVLRLNSFFNIALTCRLCEDPRCIKACPRDALTQSMETGAILVNHEKCDGCGWCIKACDYGSIAIDSDKKVAVVCDLCKSRKGIGVFPGRKIVNQACIEWCPEEALDLVTTERLAQKARKKAAEKLLKELDKDLDSK
jgi:Fe-S-cluster-containing dehydrogenase component